MIENSMKRNRIQIEMWAGGVFRVENVGSREPGQHFIASGVAVFHITGLESRSSTCRGVRKKPS